MAYVEWLRVRAAIKWTAIALLILLAVVAILRTVLFHGHHDALSWVQDERSAPGSTVTQMTLPNGDRRITIDNSAAKTHITIDEHANHKHIVIDDRSKRPAGHEIMAGSINEHDLPGGGTETVIDADNHTDLIDVLTMGLLAAAIVATVLGAPFARENDGHLETTLTKPVDRVRLACLIVLADTAAIAVAVVLGTLTAIVASTMFVPLKFTFSASDAGGAVMAFVGPLAVYALLVAATASIRRNYGVALGVVWPVMLGITGLSRLPLDTGNALLTVIHWIVWPFSWIDPLTYLHLHGSVVVNGTPVSVATQYLPNIAALVVLVLAYLVAGLAQWRRVEA
jgi:hypothetical protein